MCSCAWRRLERWWRRWGSACCSSLWWIERQGLPQPAPLPFRSQSRPPSIALLCMQGSHVMFLSDSACGRRWRPTWLASSASRRQAWWARQVPGRRQKQERAPAQSCEALTRIRNYRVAPDCMMSDVASCVCASVCIKRSCLGACCSKAVRRRQQSGSGGGGSTGRQQGWQQVGSRWGLRCMDPPSNSLSAAPGLRPRSTDVR